MPILRRLGLPSVFFITGECLERDSLPLDNLLSHLCASVPIGTGVGRPRRWPYSRSAISQRPGPGGLVALRPGRTARLAAWSEEVVPVAGPTWPSRPGRPSTSSAGSPKLAERAGGSRRRPGPGSTPSTPTNDSPSLRSLARRRGSSNRRLPGRGTRRPTRPALRRVASTSTRRARSPLTSPVRRSRSR